MRFTGEQIVQWEATGQALGSSLTHPGLDTVGLAVSTSVARDLSPRPEECGEKAGLKAPGDFVSSCLFLRPTFFA